MSPPLPGPAVEPAICAPPAIVRLSAPTITEPPGPDCNPVAEAAIWVLATPAPSSTSEPGVVTMTEPPAPVPAVVLAISAPEAIVIRGASTVTDPALPLAVEVAEAIIPLAGSVKLSGPCAVTSMVPPFPAPAVLELTCAPPESASAPPAVSVTSPAPPLDPGWAEAVIPLTLFGPVPDKVTPFATVTAMSPPLPGPAVVLAICAPPAIARLLASTVTDPPGPDCGPVAEAAI